jgi:DNA polymerase III alpha subunit
MPAVPNRTRVARRGCSAHQGGCQARDSAHHRLRGLRPDDRRAQAKGSRTLVAQDNAGYSDLIKLSSLGYVEGYYYTPRIESELLDSHSQGLIALSSCLPARVPRALEENGV